jgi:hypothetical protein
MSAAIYPWDVHQQPHLLRVQFEGNFIRILKNIFKFRTIRAMFNSLPGHQKTPYFSYAYGSSNYDYTHGWRRENRKANDP